MAQVDTYRRRMPLVLSGPHTTDTLPSLLRIAARVDASVAAAAS